MEDLEVASELTIPSTEIEWVAIRASGPGGQNVNKVSSKIELRFDLRGSTQLSRAVKDRIHHRYPNRIGADGRLIVRSQRTRSAQQNLADAREQLRQIILSALYPPKTRRPTRPTRGSQERRIREKRHTGERKRNRSSREEY